MTRRAHTAKPKRSAELLRLTFDTDAHAMMDIHCAASPRHEVCGVLVGFTGLDAVGRWTRVISVIEGRHAREEQMSVTFTHETWDAVHAQLAKRKDKAMVVGWYHTHPDFGIFYSAPDVFVHRNFFGLEGQVGVVLDPVRNERGVFGNTSQGLHPISHYEVARMNKGGHRIHCTYVGEPLREARIEARAAAEDAEISGAGATYTRTSLNSIEAGMARIERQIQFMSRMAIAGVPLLLFVGFLAGMFIGCPPRSNENPLSKPTSERSSITSQGNDPSDANQKGGKP